jgi:hypothetical protein
MAIQFVRTPEQKNTSEKVVFSRGKDEGKHAAGAVSAIFIAIGGTLLPFGFMLFLPAAFGGQRSLQGDLGLISLGIGFVFVLGGFLLLVLVGKPKQEPFWPRLVIFLILLGLTVTWLTRTLGSD